jgi:hypothetical protein
MYVNARSSSPYRCAITAPSLQRAVVEQHSSYHRFIYGPVLLRCGENLKLFKRAQMHLKLRNKPAFYIKKETNPPATARYRHLHFFVAGSDHIHIKLDRDSKARVTTAGDRTLASAPSSKYIVFARARTCFWWCRDLRKAGGNDRPRSCAALRDRKLLRAVQISMPAGLRSDRGRVRQAGRLVCPVQLSSVEGSTAGISIPTQATPARMSGYCILLVSRGS